MRQISRPPVRGLMIVLLLACATQANVSLARSDTPDASAETLRAQFADFQARLDRTPFQEPLVLDSTQSERDLAGDVHALIDHPFAVVRSGLSTAAHWCDILTLHPNVKHCHVSQVGEESLLTACVGAKRDEAATSVHCAEFSYRVAASTADVLRVALSAERGPFGTRNYRMLLEAVPIDSTRTFLHFSYSYLSGLAARMAMDGYLGTAGSAKVGFTVVNTRGDGKPSLVRGMRGALERNIMRYYLAIEAYLGSLSAPPDQRFEKRLRDWFASCERYPRQLRELNESEYLEMKRKEFRGAVEPR